MNIEKLFNEFPIIDCGQYIFREITKSDTEDIYEIYSDYENVIYDRISTEINPSNVASLNLVKSLGFDKEGVLRDYSYNVHANNFEDRVIYSLLSSTL